jgi:hypothetical protein
VVVLKPMFEDEHMMRCAKCNSIGLASPHRQRSNYYAQKETRKNREMYRRFVRICKRCTVARVKAYEEPRYEQKIAYLRKHAAEKRERRRVDPEFREQQREQWRRNNARTTRNYEKNRAAARRRYRKRRDELQSTAEGRKQLANERTKVNKQIRERKAFKRAEERERAGLSLEIPEVHKSKSTRMLPVGPFQHWILRLVVDELCELQLQGVVFDASRESLRLGGVMQTVAERLNVAPRRVYNWLQRQDEIDESAVDRAVSRYGTIMIHELYPECL